MKRQIALKIAREPIQVQYPKDFKGQRSQALGQTEIFITTQPTVATDDEIEFIEAYIRTLPYPQRLAKGAVLIDEDDPLLGLSHAELNKVEQDANFACTEKAVGSGQRSIRERVLILREAGFLGNGTQHLLEAG